MQVPHWGWFVLSIIFSIFWGMRAAICPVKVNEKKYSPTEKTKKEQFCDIC